VIPTLEDVKTDTAELIDIGMIDLGQEANLGRSHGVVVWEEELELEDASYRRKSASHVPHMCIS
jgi:hypothetical protein